MTGFCGAVTSIPSKSIELPRWSHNASKIQRLGRLWLVVRKKIVIFPLIIQDASSALIFYPQRGGFLGPRVLMLPWKCIFAGDVPNKRRSVRAVQEQVLSQSVNLTKTLHCAFALRFTCLAVLVMITCFDGTDNLFINTGLGFTPHPTSLPTGRCRKSHTCDLPNHSTPPPVSYGIGVTVRHENLASTERTAVNRCDSPDARPKWPHRLLSPRQFPIYEAAP